MSTEKIHFKEINKLALPSIVAGIAEPLISLTDIAVIGNVQQHAVEALAAAGIVGSFIAAVVWTLAQTKTSISSIVSQHLGANRLHAIKTLVPQVIWLNVLLGLLLLGFTYFFARQILELYNAEGRILQYSVDYYRIRAIGFPITLATFAIFGVFRGMQNTLWAMIASLSGALLNIGLDFLLVYGFYDLIPPMHLQGAAYASIAAQSLMLGIALYFLFTKTPFRLKVRKAYNPNLRQHISLSANLFLRTIALNFAIYLANAYATDYGKNYIAAHSILMNIWLFFAFFIDGFSNAGNAIAGKLIGAKAYKKLWNLALDLSKYAIAVAILLILACMLAYNTIGQVFIQDQAVLAIFSSLFWIILAMQPLNALTFVFDGLFKGMGKAAFLRNTLFAATFLGFVPTLLITNSYGLQLRGVWIAFIVWMLVRGGTLIIKFRKDYL
ncbi:MAG: MATE family efflux transporter [Flavobacteriaceae bacterium]|nr:MATE family efflux transporter [Flavobacteriaceae bacterium]